MHKLFATALLLAFAWPATAAPKDRVTPYWASISAREAMMRSGPGRNFPAVWLYRRADLPIKVLEIYPSWRKVEDPGGAVGWMLVNLLSDRRTAVVTGNEARPMYAKPDAASRLIFRAEPGVVGRVSKCSSGWCRIDAGGKAGFISVDHIWGVGRNEEIG